MVNSVQTIPNSNHFPLEGAPSCNSVCSAAFRAIKGAASGAAGLAGRMITSLQEGLVLVFQVCWYGSSAVNALIMLEVKKLLTPENRKAVLGHPNPRSIADALIRLQDANILTAENRARVSRAQFPRDEVDRLLFEFAMARLDRPIIILRNFDNNFVNVHEGRRDELTRNAIETFYRSSASPSQEQIQQAYDEFIAYISTKTDEIRFKALHALNQQKVLRQSFGPLVSDVPFTYLGREIHGKELVARLWNFTSNLADAKDQKNAKDGMVSALLDSYDGQSLVCNQGKTQRLMIAVVQGRMEGVNIEGQNFGTIKTTDAVNMFFAIESNRNIAKLKPLLRAATQFCNENPNVDRDAFLNEIQSYARVEEFPEGE